MGTIERIAEFKALLDTVGRELIELVDRHDDPDVGRHLKAELLDIPRDELRLMVESGRTLRMWRERAHSLSGNSQVSQ